MQYIFSTLTRSALKGRPHVLHAIHGGFAQQCTSTFITAIANNSVASTQKASFSALPAHSLAIDAIEDVIAEEKAKGTITKTLKALDMAVVRQIKAELLSVDRNNDGRQVQMSS
jgi:hypothetical protein